MPPADPIPLPLHGLFEIAAFVAGGWVYRRQGRSRPLANGIPEPTRWRILVGAGLGALIGSRALAALEHPGLFDGASGVQVALLVFGTKTIVGGLLGGLVGVEIAKRAMGERRRSGDAFVFPLVAAIAVGRVGCFLAGVDDGTAGVPTDLPWGMDQGDGIPRHPTALYEILVLLALGAALLGVQRRQRPLAPGVLFALFLSGYLAWRLGAEFVKPVAPLAMGLSAIQWACVAGLLHYLRLFAGRRFVPGSAVASGAR
ncbi:prolipoprotein diacylglyceryl transferase [Rubricoccus marinus]|uniref:Diacylglyceryl transferase n=1 Tax=Rubricoccus marinus TaxID=716817 RepID=A0A259TX32_9BACT|nr:prolipoprotein diacylglyceryl transferase family protein [Rubricoccus marinus]OZC02332.1 hypothetical protein BSZ36_04675 [Rubricoccus marinus]